MKFLYENAGAVSGLFLSFLTIFISRFYLGMDSGWFYLALGVSLIPTILILDDLAMKYREHLISKRLRKELNLYELL